MNIFKLFLVLGFTFFLCTETYSQEIKAENIKIDNQKDQIIINYDVNNPEEYTCLVDLTMKKKNDKSFRYQPRYVSGDIGEGDFNGLGKKIIWNKQRERLPMINADEFIFEINVRVISRNNNTWLWVGAGAALVGGGAALYFLLKEDDNGSTGGSSANLPQPPGRP